METEVKDRDRELRKEESISLFIFLASSKDIWGQASMSKGCTEQSGERERETDIKFVCSYSFNKETYYLLVLF